MQRHKRIWVLLMVAILVFSSSIFAFAESNGRSSFWGDGEVKSNGKTFEEIVEGSFEKKDANGNVVPAESLTYKNIISRYKLVTAEDLNITGNAFYTLTLTGYNISKEFAGLTIAVSYFAKNFSLFDSCENILNTIFQSYNTYFTTDRFLKSGLVVFAFFVAGLAAIFFLMTRRVSRAVSQFAVIGLVIVLAFVLFANTTATLNTIQGLTEEVTDVVEESICGGTDLYTQILDTMVVRPYNYLQYGDGDPLSSTGVMRKVPSMYNYMLTWGNKDAKLFGSMGPEEYIRKAGDKNNPLGSGMHGMVAEDIAGQSDVPEIISWLGVGIEDLTNAIISADGQGIMTDATKPYTIGDDEIGKNFENSVGKWSDVCGTAMIMILVYGMFALVFLGIAVFQILGQMMILFIFLLMLLILMWSMFKGFEPIRQAGLFVVMGFLFSILGAAARGLLIIMLDILIKVSHGNVYIMCLLIITIAAFLILFGKKIPQIFGIDTSMLPSMRNTRYARRSAKYLRAAAREKKKERKEKEKEEKEKFKQGADVGKTESIKDKDGNIQSNGRKARKGEESEVQAEKRRQGTERGSEAVKKAARKRLNAQSTLNAPKNVPNTMEGNKQSPTGKMSGKQRQGIVPKNAPSASVAERAKASMSGTEAETRQSLGAKLGAKAAAAAAMPSGIKRNIKERVAAAPTEAKYQIYRSRQQAIDVVNDTKTKISNRVNDARQGINQNIGDFKNSYKTTQGTNRVVREERAEAYRTRVETKRNFVNEVERQSSIQKTEKSSIKQIQSNRKNGTTQTTVINQGKSASNRTTIINEGGGSSSNTTSVINRNQGASQARNQTVTINNQKSIAEKHAKKEKPITNTNRYTKKANARKNKKKK